MTCQHYGCPHFLFFFSFIFFLKSIVTLKWDMNIAQISVANNVLEYAFIDQIAFFKIAIEISRNITVFHIYRTCCIILLICLSVSHILQSCVGKHLSISKKNKKKIVCRKTLVRIITSSPYKAHTASLLLANRLLSVSEINNFVGIFMYNCINGILSTTFSDYHVRNRDVHQCNTRQADDLLVPFGKLNVRKFRIKYMVPKYGILCHGI